MIIVDLPDETATVALARRISRLAQRGDIIALKGDLGSGKTAFARAFIRARGDRNEEVPSPTFTLVQIYEFPPAAIWHFDLRMARAVGSVPARAPPRDQFVIRRFVRCSAGDA